jgi:nucleoside-diphosphate-sugar epimerase
VLALTRSEQRASELRGAGVEPVVGDWLEAASLEKLESLKCDHVLVAVPHRPVAELGAQTHVLGLSNLVERLRNTVEHWVYLSTTGVYGDCDNEVVDETTEVSPTRIGPEIAVAAEQWLLQQRQTLALNATTLRLAGIYGPGRVPLAAKLLAGEPLAVPREGHLNLVHVTDIARMILQILPQRMQHPLYLFSDGQPVLRETFYRELARLCGVDNPSFVDPEPGDSKARRATDKQVNPRRLVTETGFVYQFPNYQVGLASALQMA